MATLLAMAIVWEFALHPVIGVVNDILPPWLRHRLGARPADRLVARPRCGRELVWKKLRRRFSRLVRRQEVRPGDDCVHRDLAGVRLQHGALPRGPDRSSAGALRRRGNGRSRQRLGALQARDVADARPDARIRRDHHLDPLVPGLRYGRGVDSRGAEQVHLRDGVRDLREGGEAEPPGDRLGHHHRVPRLRPGAHHHPGLLRQPGGCTTREHERELARRGAEARVPAARRRRRAAALLPHAVLFVEVAGGDRKQLRGVRRSPGADHGSTMHQGRTPARGMHDAAHGLQLHRGVQGRAPPALHAERRAGDGVHLPDPGRGRPALRLCAGQAALLGT